MLLGVLAVYCFADDGLWLGTLGVELLYSSFCESSTGTLAGSSLGGGDVLCLR